MEINGIKVGMEIRKRIWGHILGKTWKWRRGNFKGFVNVKINDLCVAVCMLGYSARAYCHFAFSLLYMCKDQDSPLPSGKHEPL